MWLGALVCRAGPSCSMFLICVAARSFSDAQPSGDRGKKQSRELPGPQAAVKEINGRARTVAEGTIVLITEYWKTFIEM